MMTYYDVKDCLHRFGDMQRVYTRARTHTHTHTYSEQSREEVRCSQQEVAIEREVGG